MARLPIPGSDVGEWGDILNDYLGVSLASDGTIKAGTIDTAALQDNSITNAKLASGSGSNGQALTKDATLSSGFKWANPVDTTALHKGDFFYNVKDYGAVGNGTTDDTAAIQTTINTAASTGGVVFFPIGTYIVAPTTTTFITVPSNIELRGLGIKSVIKVKNDAGDYQKIFGQANPSTLVENITFRDLTIDQNATGNTTCDIAIGSTRAQFAISFATSKHILIQNCRFDPCTGVNTISINAPAAEDARIINCYFHFVRGVSSTDYDNSTIYFTCANHAAIGNIFKADVGEGARGAMETHDGQSVITGNVSDGYQTGVNIVNAANIGGSLRENNDITVSGNTFARACYGIRLWSVTGSTLRNVTVSGNTVSLSQVDHNEIGSSGINLEYASGTTLNGSFENITIANNSISFQPELNRSVDGDGNALAASSTWGIGLSPAGNVKNLQVINNVIRNAPVKGISIGQGTTYTLTNIRIRGNMLVDAGQNAGITAGLRAAFFIVGNLTNAYIEDNQIWDSGNGSGGTLGNQYRYYFPNTVSYVTWRNNTVQTVSGTLASSVDSTKFLETAPVVAYNTTDQVTNTEKVFGSWGSYGIGQNAFGIFTTYSGTGVTRPLMIGAGWPSTTPAQTNAYMKFQTQALPYVNIHASSFGNNGILANIDTNITAGSTNSSTMFAINPTILSSGSAGYTMLLVNPTETTVGTGQKLLADFQVGGTSLAKIDNKGRLSAKGLALSVTTKTANYTLTTADNSTICDATTAPFTITLPDATTCSGQIYRFYKKDASANALTIATAPSSQLIFSQTAPAGANTYSLSGAGKSICLQSDGAGWYVMSSN